MILDPFLTSWPVKQMKDGKTKEEKLKMGVKSAKIKKNLAGKICLGPFFRRAGVVAWLLFCFSVMREIGNNTYEVLEIPREET